MLLGDNSCHGEVIRGKILVSFVINYRLENSAHVPEFEHHFNGKSKE